MRKAFSCFLLAPHLYTIIVFFKLLLLFRELSVPDMIVQTSGSSEIITRTVGIFMCKYVRKVGLFFRVVGYRVPSGINEKFYVHKCNYSPGQFTLFWLHKTWGI